MFGFWSKQEIGLSQTTKFVFLTKMREASLNTAEICTNKENEPVC